MKIEGFKLLLEDYCAYCPNFEPEVEQIDCTSYGEAPRYINNIRCGNSRKCDRIAENLRKRINEKMERKQRCEYD